MKQTRRDECIHVPESVDRISCLRVQCDGGVNKQSSVGEAHDGHSRSDLETEEAKRSRLDPDVIGDAFKLGYASNAQRFQRPPSANLDIVTDGYPTLEQRACSQRPLNAVNRQRLLR